jgi:hypothetical protein
MWKFSSHPHTLHTEKLTKNTFQEFLPCFEQSVEAACNELQVSLPFRNFFSFTIAEKILFDFTVEFIMFSFRFGAMKL